MKIEINLKGEIKDEDLTPVRAELAKLKKLMVWYKLNTIYEELKQK